MRIPLKNDYRYKDNATVVNDILCIYSEVSFKSLMYDLTCAVKNSKICYYCHCPIHFAPKRTKRGDSRDFRSIDHLYPRSLGGPTIPNNLEPCCASCNNTKQSITEDDFLELMKLKGDEKSQFMECLISKYEDILKHHVPYIPESWYLYCSPDRIRVIHKYASYKEYRKTEYMYNKSGKIFAPIVVDRNYVLLDGYGILDYVKEHKLDKIPVIVLENVEVKYS